MLGPRDAPTLLVAANTRAFGVGGTKAAEICFEHKKDGMVNVDSKKRLLRLYRTPTIRFAESNKREFSPYTSTGW